MAKDLVAWRALRADLPKLDRIDINILVQLQNDGALTNVHLSERVGLSPSPCLQRVKRLERAGYITGYGACINLAKFEANVRDIDELMECHLVSGGYDYLLRFLTRSIAHYQEHMEDLLRRN